jgi:hypothetical protein
MIALNISLFVIMFIFFKYSQQQIEKVNTGNTGNTGNTENMVSTETIITNSLVAFGVEDRLLNSKFILKINKYLHDNLYIGGYLFIITSLMIDVGAIIILLKFIFLNEYETPLVLLIGILLRQLCQLTTKLPKPVNLLWFDPGFPSLFVTYNVTSDFFFSGHTFFSLVVGLDFFSSEFLVVKLYSIAFMFLEITFVIVTHSHYWMDIYSAITTYFAIRYFILL